MKHFEIVFTETIITNDGTESHLKTTQVRGHNRLDAANELLFRYRDLQYLTVSNIRSIIRIPANMVWK